MSEKMKMTCPSCGAEMNFHAEKLVYSEANLSGRTAIQASVEEMHACPKCGRAESRSSTDTGSGYLPGAVAEGQNG